MVKSNENGAYKRGQELLDQGMYREAIDQFDIVIEEQPQSWKALNSKGFAFQKMSRYTEAVECFDKALALTKNYHLEKVNQVLVDLKTKGELREGIDVEMLAHIILSTYYGIVFSCLSRRFAYDITSMVRMGLGLLFEGLKRKQ